MGSIIGLPTALLFNGSGTFLFQRRWIKDPQVSLSLDMKCLHEYIILSILGHFTGSLKVHMHQQCVSGLISIGNVI